MCSGTQPAVDLVFGLPPLPEKAWRARAFPPGLASHKGRRSVQKKCQVGGTEKRARASQPGVPGCRYCCWIVLDYTSSSSA